MSNQYAIVVDDNQADRYLATRAIKRSGFSSQILEFEDGADASQFFSNTEEFSDACGPHPPPTLIFLDINMPRMDGFELLNKLETLSNEGLIDLSLSCVVVMLTSSNFTGDKEKAAKYEVVSEYMEKPIDLKKMEDLLERHNHFRG